MISSLRGELTQIEENALILQNSGLGFRVFVPKPLISKFTLGDFILLQTHLVVRENDLSLYGFETTGDRQLFLMLLGVDGVGPKLALSVLSTLDLDAVKQAVFSDEPDLLSRVPGVGKRTAQKMQLYLKDRLKPTGPMEKLITMSETDSELLSALTSLGYSVVEAQSALQSLPKDAPDDLESKIRLALSYFQ